MPPSEYFVGRLIVTVVGMIIRPGNNPVDAAAKRSDVTTLSYPFNYPKEVLIVEQ
jgi:hypothetical protein